MTPVEPGFFEGMIDKAWAAFAALVGITWRANEAKHKETRKNAADALAAHAAEDEKARKRIDEELQLHRQHIAKLFDQQREESQRSDQRHHELMQRMHDGHRELMLAMNSKADK